MLPATPDQSRLIAAKTLKSNQGVLPKRNKNKLRARANQIMEKNRFISGGGANITAEEVRFGAAMQTYMGSVNRASWTCGQVLDVLVSLGYRNTQRDFEVNVHRFTVAIAALKKGISPKTRRRFPTWGEVLAVACSLGWYLRAEKKRREIA